MQRRNFAAGASLIALVAAGGCTSQAGNANAQVVFAQVQYLLPLVKMLAGGIAIAEPKAAGIVALVTPYLDSAGTAFQSMSATMTQVQAMPIAQQIAGYGKSVVDAIANVVNGAAPGSKLAQFAPMVTEAQAVLALIVAFANGVQAMPTARVSGSLKLLHR